MTHYCVHYSPLFFCILSQINPIYTLPSYFFKIHFSIIHSQCLGLWNNLFHTGLLTKTLHTFRFSSIHATCTTYPVLQEDTQTFLSMHHGHKVSPNNLHQTTQTWWPVSSPTMAFHYSVQQTRSHCHHFVVQLSSWVLPHWHPWCWSCAAVYWESDRIGSHLKWGLSLANQTYSVHHDFYTQCQHHVLLFHFP